MTLKRIPESKLSPRRRRAPQSLAGIFALRMFGLFMICPVFAVYARTGLLE